MPYILLSSLKSQIFVIIAAGLLLAVLSNTPLNFPTLPDKEAVSKGRVVELSETGFNPAWLVINRGEVVRFITRREKPFWPASDNHPFHLIYQEFDPKKYINPGETWEFKFDKAGEWDYHDHLFSSYRGVIVVLDEGASDSRAASCTKLSELDNQSKRYCFQKLLTGALEAGGIKKAYEVFKKLYETEPLFANDSCHSYAHIIGDAAYGIYFKKTSSAPEAVRDMDLPPETSWCGYGFYHGLFEHMFRDRQDISLVKTLCDELGEKYAGTMPIIRKNCYHAAGHGFVSEPLTEETWGNAQAIVSPALKKCEIIAPEHYLVLECKEGAFNVIANWTWGKEYGLSPDEKDPLTLCRRQSTRDDEVACYFEFAMRLKPNIKGDLVKFNKLFLKDVDAELAKIMISSAAAGLMEDFITREDNSSFVYMCRKLPEGIKESCLKGVVLGFVAHGDPGKEYIKGAAFCALKIMTEEERERCYPELVSFLAGSYPEKELKTICEDFIPENYRSRCPS